MVAGCDRRRTCVSSKSRCRRVVKFFEGGRIERESLLSMQKITKKRNLEAEREGKDSATDGFYAVERSIKMKENLIAWTH